MTNTTFKNSAPCHQSHYATTERDGMSFKSGATIALFAVMFVVYLQTIGDLPELMVAPSYNTGQLTPADEG